jgi:hypothetical protein
MRDSLLGASWVERWVTGLAIGAVAVFVVWALTQAGEIARVVYASSDNASAPLLAEFFGDRDAGGLTLGNYLWLEPLYALHLTRWLPDHLAVWEAMPFVGYAATIGLLAWTVKRAVSGRAALLVALAMAVPEHVLVPVLGAPNQRLPVLAHCVLLAAFLITASELPAWSRPARWLWAAALAVTLAPGVAGDPLTLLAGVAPFLAAVAIGWRLRLVPGRPAAIAAVACLLGTAGGFLLVVQAHRVGIVDAPNAMPLASPGDMASNAWLLLKDVGVFAHGHFGDTDTMGRIAAVLGALAVLAQLTLVVLCVARGRRLLTDSNRRPEQRLLALFWAVSVLAVCLAFIVSSAPVDLASVRYLLPVWPAALVLFLIVAERGTQLPIAALAAVLAVLGCIDLANGRYASTAGSLVMPDEAKALARFSQSNGLDHGYAGYWEAASSDELSRFGLHAYPVTDCGLTKEARCPFHQHMIAAWYRPKPRVRTFYVYNARPSNESISRPLKRWGRPVRKARFGSLTVWVYDYDLASVFPPGTHPPPKSERAG